MTDSTTPTSPHPSTALLAGWALTPAQAAFLACGEQFSFAPLV
jgi:hypothetical protein